MRELTYFPDCSSGERTVRTGFDANPVLTSILIVYAWISLFSFQSCTQSDENPSGRSGTLDIRLAADTASLKKGVASPLSKALPDEFEKFLITDDYTVRIVRDGDTLETYPRYDEMPVEIRLTEGVYSLVASKGENVPAAFENPYFEGTSGFKIYADMNTPIDVTCTLANARITVEYTDDFREAYTSHTVLLSSPFLSSPFEIGADEQRPAYLQVAPEGSEVGIHIRLKKVGDTKEKTYKVPTPLPLERRQNVRLIFKTDGEALDGIGLDVLIDDELTEVALDEGIPDFMWQQFDKPVLRSESFGNGTFVINPGQLEAEPSVGFQVPAGIGGFYIDTWRESAVDEADTVRYDLAVAEDAGGRLGAVSAVQAGYNWSYGQNAPLAGVRDSRQLYLRTAINNLAGPEFETDDPYVYHIRLYACDRLPKVNYTDTLELIVKVNAAGSPVIIFPSQFPQLIVEGDVMDKDTVVVIAADNGIDKENTSLTLIRKPDPDNLGSVRYLLSSASDVQRLAQLGIRVEEESNKRIKLVFQPGFTEKLSAPEIGSSTVTYQIDLQESGAHQRQATDYRSIEVKAPVFTLETSEGDAFAKRIVLRADMPVGRPEKLKFEYQKEGDGDLWTPVYRGLLQDPQTHWYVDTVKGLDSSAAYRIRAVYDNARKRYSNRVMTVRTETPGELPNPSFEYWSIAPDENGSTAEALTKEISGIGSISATLDPPYRYWEVWQPWDASSNAGWNTLNLYTTQDGKPQKSISFVNTKYPWTRYTANSGTIRTAGRSGSGALIRTVGWGDGCSAVGESSAAVIKQLTPGELYLGSCSGLDPVYGLDFDSRPSGFRFDYKYSTLKGADTFIAEIVVLASDGTILATAQLPPSQAGTTTEWSTAAVRLHYDGDYGRRKAARMYIRFRSSSSSNYDFLRDNLMVWPPNTDLSRGEYVGSQLSIDNVELIYE